MLACRPQALEHLGRGLADLVGHFFAPSLHVSRIKGDEGELDALATYLEAVQVFLRQHIHSRNDICCSTSFHLHMRDRHLHATRPVGQKDSEHEL